MQARKWTIAVISFFGAAIIFIGITVYVVDPYFHYHAPIDGLSYKLDKYEYQNNGITKHFTYDAIITGTSLTECTSTDEINELFNVDSVRLTFLGEGFKRISENLELAFEENQDVNIVIWGLDTMMFITDKDYCKNDVYPTYLYDSNLLNDVKYVYNIDVLLQDVLPEIIRTISREPADTFDKKEEWKADIGSRERVLNGYNRPTKSNIVRTEQEVEEYIARLENNLEQNVLNIIKNNTDVTFYIFFPPYSICWWDSHHQGGNDVLSCRIALEEKAIEMLLPYENVKLYSFFNNFDLITDLDNYRDEYHYASEINSQILTWIKNDEYRLTQENYINYINEITDFYTTYNYETAIY